MNKFSQFPINKRIISGLLFVFIFAGSWSQVFYSGKPLFHPATDTTKIPVVLIKVIAKPEIQKETQGIHFKSDDFAVPVKTDINTDEYGVWKEYPKKNKRVWLLAISSPGAASLNLILNPFNLKPGAKLFFYDSTQTQIVGAITFLNNKPSEILPVSVINGDKIYCELQVPMFLDDYGLFTIYQVGVESNGGVGFKSANDEWFNRSQSCNVNINCVYDVGKQRQKNAVCRIIYLGTRRCTGTLINNLENDGTPYVLTAAHCINKDYAASTAVFYFNYESPDCENIDGPIHSVSGATLVAAGNHMSNTDTLDFALLKLSEKPPINYFPYYSGWDATGVVPDSTYVIHHPEGDIKKISVDLDKPETQTLGIGFDLNTHWYIRDYEVGTSEDGSSGSGLVDNNNKLIGTLSAGGEPCQKYISDYYQKLADSYNDYSDEKYQLKKWLDPKNTNKLVCNGFDASGALRESAQSLTNISDTNLFKNIKNTKGWGYISGHNYQKNNLFAEHFSIPGSKYLYGAYITPSVSYSNSINQLVDFFIAKGGDKPGKIIYEKSIPVMNIDAGYRFYVDFDSTLLVTNDFYFGYKIQYDSDTFALYTEKSGIWENSAFTYIKGGWNTLRFDGNEYPSHLAVTMLAFDLMPEKGVEIDTSEWSEISVYPNPASNQLQIYLKKQVTGEINCTLFDISGRPVKQQSFINQGQNLPLNINIEGGVYILQVKLPDENPKSFKILVE